MFKKIHCCQITPGSTVCQSRAVQIQRKFQRLAERKCRRREQIEPVIEHTHVSDTLNVRRNIIVLNDGEGR